MTWVKLDDQFVTHPKAVAAGLHGRALFIAGLCYCSANLTDGTIPKQALPIVAAMAGTKASAAKTLVTVGLWVDHDDRYEVHGFLDYNPSSDKIRADRDAAAERQKKWRESRSDKRNGHGVTSPVSNGVSSPSPSRPVPSPELSSSSNKSNRSTPPNNDDDDDDQDQQLWNLLAQRRADLEHPHGTGIRQPSVYMKTLVNDHRERLADQAHDLRAEHPDWTVEQLADDLDPDTATDARNYLDAAETEAVLIEQRAREQAAAPMPEHMRTR